MSDDPHARFEQLAVDHVLGGLEQIPAAEFRGHLVGCSACRAQVAELRELASHLEATEREQRRTNTKLEVSRRPTEEAPPRTGRPTPTWAQVVAAVGTVLLLAGVLFWNLHLRTVSLAGEQLAQIKAAVLETLAVGQPVPATFADGVDGVVVRDGATVALSVVGVGAVPEGRELVLWLLPQQRREVVPAVVVDAGRLALRTDVVVPTELVLSVEPVGSAATQPSGRVLLRAVIESVEEPSRGG